MVVDQKLLDTLGLGMGTLYSTKGSLCAENFDKVIEAFSPLRGNVESETRGALADGFNLWGLIAPASLKQQTLHQHKEEIYQLIVELIKEGIDSYDPNADEEYKGNVYIASRLAHALLHAGQLDTTMELMAEIAPLAYRTIEEVLPFCSKFDVKNSRNFRDTPNTLRTDLLEALLHTIPSNPPIHGGKLELHNAFIKVIYPMLSGTNHTKIKAILPHKLKQCAENAIGILLKVSESSILPYSKELLDLGKDHGCHLVLQLFASHLNLYLSNIQLVNDHIHVFIQSVNHRESQSPPLLSQTSKTSSLGTGVQNRHHHAHAHNLSYYHSLTPLFVKIAQQYADLLIPYVEFFVLHLKEEDSLIATLTILYKMAQYDSTVVLPYLNNIHQNIEEIIKVDPAYIDNEFRSLYAHILALLCKSTEQCTAAERILGILIELVQDCLNSKDDDKLSTLVMVINALHQVSQTWKESIEVIRKHEDIFSQCKSLLSSGSSAALARTIIIDWFDTTPTFPHTEEAARYTAEVAPEREGQSNIAIDSQSIIAMVNSENIISDCQGVQAIESSATISESTATNEQHEDLPVETLQCATRLANVPEVITVVTAEEKSEQTTFIANENNLECKDVVVTPVDTTVATHESPCTVEGDLEVEDPDRKALMQSVTTPSNKVTESKEEVQQQENENNVQNDTDIIKEVDGNEQQRNHHHQHHDVEFPREKQSHTTEEPKVQGHQDIADVAAIATLISIEDVELSDNNKKVDPIIRSDHEEHSQVVRDEQQPLNIVAAESLKGESRKVIEKDSDISREVESKPDTNPQATVGEITTSSPLVPAASGLAANSTEVSSDAHRAS